MCIICVKPIGIEMPSHDLLKSCWQGNEDGAGLAYCREGEQSVSINKGFMKLKGLKNHLDALALGINDMAILHFRFATHGVTDRGNCHPFPLSNKSDELRSKSIKCPVAIAHNGVFGNMPEHDTLSDTQKFISKIMCNPAIINNLDNRAIRELISGYCGHSSKLAILRPGKLLLIGDFIKENGLLFSNYGFRTSVQYCETYKPNNRTHITDDNDSNDFKFECELCDEKDEDKIQYRDDFEMWMCDICHDFNEAQAVGMAHG